MPTTIHSTTHRTSRRLPRILTASLGAVGILALSACANGTESQNDGDTGETGVTAETATTDAATETETASESNLEVPINDPEGTELGIVQISEANDTVRISAELTGLEPGFYGFHIHGTGLCEPDSADPDDPTDTGDFLSAGGHLGSDEAEHPDHAGDLPQLLVQESGDATLAFVTDRLTLADLQDEDGSAVMIHSGPDNYANIPERYAPEGPDDDTTSTGDAGSRIACGVIE